MRHDQIKKLEGEKFYRLTGVKAATFARMVDILREADNRKKSHGGRRNTLSREDQLRMALEYIREYRTYFHIGQSYGVSESSAYKTVRWVEDTLIKHPDFALPGKKALVKSDTAYEVVLIDATESPIERPKKNKNNSTLARRSDTR